MSTGRTKTAAPVATVDAQNPWLGLVSFTEETRSYFHGRDEEAAELGRRVQRKLLTILFGQSGLGKTSILQAGLVPRLRPEGYCPVYVRLDYDPHSPSPSEQIKRAVFRATQAAGTWTQTGAAIGGESLWEFLHHRDDVLKDADGRTLTPILIFDQFEEIFTLAQSDDAGRKRAQEFVADLADLVENRPPAALEARIERDETDAAKFDFARADYRILISLREDYLAHLEGLKGQMPSVTQNRMRLARMTGAQAVAAVRAPAPHLVGEAVAEAVVRFVAGGADLARAEVEPSLLSLICRELNTTRLAKGEAEISANLLAGSRDTILSEFYERALADQPPGVRIFIEDEMLTDSGFRESVAEERVRKAFVSAGAGEGALATLVDRRLLRVEDRLDLRRVEITHDVLCSVVGASRGVRRAREALEESKRQLAAQQEREAATRRALVRARMIAAVASVLMLLAAGSAVFGWINLRRAEAADAEARRAKDYAERARSEAEKLVAFLLEDFYEELVPTGRTEIVGKLADQAVAYYDRLPAGLMTPQTRLYRGMALVRKSGSLGNQGKAVDAAELGAQARQIFEQLQAEGNGSDEVTLGLALSYYFPGSTLVGRANKEALATAAQLLRPLVASGKASRSVKLALAEILNHYSHTLPREQGIAACEEARVILVGLGARELTDLMAASAYGDVTDSQSRFTFALGRFDEAEALARTVAEFAEKVLVQRPGDLRAMQNRYYAANVQTFVAEERGNSAAAWEHNHESAVAVRNYTSFNPADAWGWQSLASAGNGAGDIRFDQGRVVEARAEYGRVAALERDPRNKTGSNGGIYFSRVRAAFLETELGNIRTARVAVAEMARVGERLFQEGRIDAELRQIGRFDVEQAEAMIQVAEGDFAAAHARLVNVGAQLSQLEVKNPANRRFVNGSLRRNRTLSLDSAIRLSRFEEAVAGARENLAKLSADESLDKFEINGILARAKVQLGAALLGAGRRDEALEPLTEAVTHYRSERTRGQTDTTRRQNLARGLYYLARAQANDEPSRERSLELLHEAASTLEGLSIEAQQLRTSKELIEWVNQARRVAAR